MKVSMYRLFEHCFDKSFNFMLNRIAEHEGVKLPENLWDDDYTKERCWNEFCLALDELGLEFDEEVADE